MRKYILSIIVLCAIQIICVAQSSFDYKAITKTTDEFVVCGNSDKMVVIDFWGNVNRYIPLSEQHNLNDIAFSENAILAVGDRGSLVLIQGDNVEEIKFGDIDLKCVVPNKGNFLIGIDKVVYRISRELEFMDSYDLGLSGNIIKLSSSESGSVCGITDRNEVLCSKDGANWKVTDFNSEYKSYYDSTDLVTAAAGESSFAIAGITELGAPSMFFSSDGTVWAQREMSYLDHGTPVAFSGIPTSLVYDKDNDRMLLLCNEGEIFIVPNCSHCNSVTVTGGKSLSDAAVNMGAFFVVGKQGYVYSSLEQ